MLVRLLVLGFDTVKNNIEQKTKPLKEQPLSAVLETPQGLSPLLLHTCCAPCSGDMVETLHSAGINFTIFFYNPNIHPEKEYLIRKDENKQFAEKLGVPFIDADYDVDHWMTRVKGLENEPERGARCTVCFNVRMERTALYAHENGFPVMATSLGISRWKDMQQVHASAQQAANRYTDVVFWDHNWRKQGGSQRMVELSKREHFYKQEYCGCVYSLRDMNERRIAKGEAPILMGQKTY